MINLIETGDISGFFSIKDSDSNNMNKTQFSPQNESDVTSITSINSSNLVYENDYYLVKKITQKTWGEYKIVEDQNPKKNVKHMTFEEKKSLITAAKNTSSKENLEILSRWADQGIKCVIVLCEGWKTERSLTLNKPEIDKNIEITKITTNFIDVEKFNRILENNKSIETIRSNWTRIRCQTGCNPGDIFIYTDEASPADRNGKLCMILARPFELNSKFDYEYLPLENLEGLSSEQLSHIYAEIFKLKSRDYKLDKNNDVGTSHFWNNLSSVQLKIENLSIQVKIEST